ncbi:IS110 family transposase [Nocardia sp. XZ_19_369]|uniref:IS110 family transposase n=1 Tax=Nocardia sp. XZ_19_369 TaxID=2769487 RepID=UPI0027D33755|nr:IS110 family transposase [Nocardia sp. XZ_19_369]
MRDRVWAGIDVGKEHHWVVAVDTDGRTVLSRRVFNDESAIASVVGEVVNLADEVSWTVDLTTAYAALLLCVLWQAGHAVHYLTGRSVHQASAMYRGEGKTDARDAKVIADQSRMRPDLPQLRPGEDLIAELRMLTGHRADLVADRTRTINRLRQQLGAVCPALERTAEITQHRGWAILLARYQRPKAIRRAGVDRLTRMLADAGVRNAAAIAQSAVAAAKSQTVRLPGEDVAAELVSELAKGVIDLDARIKLADTAIEERFRRHRLAEVITSLPGMGFRLGAEFLAAVGDPSQIESADHLAAWAGLAPVPKDSGKRTGRLQTPMRYNRALRRVFYMSALTSVRCHPESRIYYDRKRSEGKRPIQAVVCLARRRTNVLFALMRDNRTWTSQAPVTTAAA